MSKSSGRLKAKRLYQPNLTRTRKWVRKHDMLLIGAGESLDVEKGSTKDKRRRKKF